MYINLNFIFYHVHTTHIVCHHFLHIFPHNKMPCHGPKRTSLQASLPAALTIKEKKKKTRKKKNINIHLSLCKEPHGNLVKQERVVYISLYLNCCVEKITVL